MRTETKPYSFVILSNQHIASVALIHSRAFPESILTRLGPRAVANYYAWQIASSHCVAMVGTFVDGKLVGYCLLTNAHTGHEYLRHNWMILLLLFCCRPWVLWNRRLWGTRSFELLRHVSLLPTPQSTRTCPRDTLRICAICVDPSWQRGGLGRQMGAIAEAMATYLRYRRLELSVHPENVKATQFYLSTGWSRTKTAEETWDGNMWKNPTDESAAGLSAKIIGTEVTKIRREFERRDGICSNEEEVFDYASYLNRCLQRTVKRAIKSEALERARILDVGCGCGTLLRTLVSWGADRHKCYGIDLNEARIAVARRNIPGADLRLGDADLLPWSDSTFDIIIQSTVFSSILVNAMRIRIAREMVRTLKRDGVIVWYDLRMNNPGNPAVKGIRASEIAMLFMGEVLCWPCTLVPPISRRLIDRAPWLVSCLERVPLLCGHLGAVITRHRLES